MSDELPSHRAYVYNLTDPWWPENLPYPLVGDMIRDPKGVFKVVSRTWDGGVYLDVDTELVTPSQWEV